MACFLPVAFLAASLLNPDENGTLLRASWIIWLVAIGDGCRRVRMSLREPHSRCRSGSMSRPALDLDDPHERDPEWYLRNHNDDLDIQSKRDLTQETQDGRDGRDEHDANETHETYRGDANAS